tara:strand:- start:820 stop:1749 length:930 start_codon:yes stop_codon:yes gene_type:complete
MKHSFAREQIKRIIVEELARSNDEDEAKELLQKIIGLNEDEADEFEAKLKKANSFRKMAGISLLGAVAILFGGMSALDNSQEQKVQQDIEQVQQLDDETLERFGVDTGALADFEEQPQFSNSGFPTAKLGLADLSDLGNNEKIEVLWDRIDNMVGRGQLKYQRARVSSPLPGGMAALNYSDIPSNLQMPNSLATKDRYRAWLVQNILKGDKSNIGALKKFVFGNTGKWPSGSGNQKNRYSGKAQILPPEWSVAYELYGDLAEEQVSDAAQALKDPDTRGSVIQGLGAENEEQAIKFLNDILYQAGRQER